MGTCGHATPPGRSMTAPAGSDLSGRQYRWLERYRNWILAQALMYTAIILSLKPLFAIGDYLVIISIGAGFGTLLFLLSGRRLWRLYNDVRANGQVEEPDAKSTRVLYAVLSAIALLIAFELLIFFGYISGIDFLGVPAFMTGFAIVPWDVLGLVTIWEARTGGRLYLTRKGRGATMSVIRGS
jgi:hypothetical protein